MGLVLLLEFKPAAQRAHPRPRIDKQLRRRVRRNHCTNVAAVDDCAARPSRRIVCKIALELKYGKTHFGDRRYDRSCFAGRSGTDPRVVDTFWVDRPRPPHRVLGLRWIAARLEHAQRDQPVQSPGIEVSKAVMGGKQPRERPLTAGRSAVDRDDNTHGCTMSAPSSRINVSNCGKLVAIIVTSSTHTGSFDASPMTRKLIAM